MVSSESPGGAGEDVVIVFTLDYPYGNGEQFLVGELGVLATRFDRVIIVPVATRPSSAPPRAVPDNVDVIPPGGGGSLLRLARATAAHPLQTGAAILGAIRARTGIRGTLQELRFRVAARLRANAVRDRVVQLIPDRARIVFYAYWLDLPVAVALHVGKEAGFADVPIVSRAHGFDIYEERHTTNHLPQRDELLGAVSQIFSVSRAGSDHLRRRWPEHAHKISISRLGTGPATNSGNADQASVTLVTCSFIVPLKRLELLIESLVELQSRGREIRWAHIGPVDTPYARHIVHTARAALEPRSVEFVGELDNRGVRDWYADHPALAFANVSSSEGVPVSIMEALAQGIPVIATDVGGNAETIDASMGMYDGLLSGDPSVNDVADRIEGLLDADPAQYRHYVDASHAHWARSWSSEVNYESFVSNLLATAHPHERRSPRVD